MDGRSTCAEEDLKPSKAGLPYPKELTNGFIQLHDLSVALVENQEESGRKMLYGRDKWLD
jgi:hypothetical protein